MINSRWGRTALAFGLLLVASCASDDKASESTAQTDASVATSASTEPTASGETTAPVSTEPTASGETTTPVATSDLTGKCDGSEPGEVTIAVPSVSSTLDPFSASGGLGGELSAFYGVLFSFDGSTGEFVPRLAESATSNDDASVWTVTLRDGVEFGNGDPLDAAAVKASIDRHLAEGSTSVLNSYSRLIDEITVVDPLTLEFALTGSWGAFPISLTRGLGYITNVAAIDAVGAEAFATDPAGGGAGPFELDRWSPPETVVYTAKADWWGGEICISKLTYTVIPDSSAAKDAFDNGEVDIALIDARDPIISAEAKADAPNSSVLIQHAGGVLLLNTAKGAAAPATADPRIRLAVALAIDPTAVNTRAWNGVGIPQKGLLSNASEIYKETEGPAFDPERAKSLVAEVKAETGWDGSIRFDCVNNLSEAAITLAAMLDGVGFDVTLEPNRSLPQQIGIVLEGNFDIACFGQTPDEADLWDGLRGYDSTNPRNLTGFSSPEFDAALKVLQAATTVADVQSAVEGVQSVWNETNPAVVYGAFEHVLVWSDRVHGLEFNDSTTVVALFDNAYVG